MPSVVTDFGTNRDAIVSAIDAAKQGDGVVHFPAGTYEVDRVIDSLADSDGIVLHGEPGSEILIAVKDGSGFRIGGAKNLTINGLDFFSTDDGDAATNALAGLDAAGTPKACSILKIIDCEFHHFKIAPWRFSSVDTDGFWCIRNSIHDIKTDLQVSSDPLLADPDRPASGIPMSHLTNASYIGNEIHDVDAGRHSPGSRGMYLSGGIVSDILIQGNMIVNSGGIKVGRQHPRPGKEARRVMIVGNTLMDCMGAGINLAVSVFEATVVGNTITSSATVPGGWINLGAEGGPVEDIVVTNNVVNLNGSLAGGMVVNNAVRVMVKNNRLLGSSDTPVAFGGVGIRVLGDSDITLAGNEITQGFVNAIRLNRAIDGCTIEGNRIWDIELEGVEVADTDTVAEISDNQIALTHGHTAINLGTTGSDSGSLTVRNNIVHVEPGGSIKLFSIGEDRAMAVTVAGNAVPLGSHITVPNRPTGSAALLEGNHYHDHGDVATLPFAGQLLPDASAFPGIFEVTLNGPCDMLRPLYGGAAGRKVTLLIHQDDVGGHPIAWDGIYVFAATAREARAPFASTVFTFRFDGANWAKE